MSDNKDHSHMSSQGHSLANSEWLDAHFLAMQPEYEEMLRWVGLQQGWHVLDAACGNGSFLPLMANLVGASGKISAIDLATENIEIVEARAQQGKWAAPVETRVGNVLTLPYADHSFDAVWCANTTQYLSNAELQQMLSEFRRVVRPGGLIAIKEYDVSATQFQPGPVPLYIHWYEANCCAGSQQSYGLLRAIDLSRWLRATGLVDIRQKPTLILRFYPLRPVEKEFVNQLMKFWYQESLKLDLPPEDIEVWRQMADTDSSNHITNDLDFQYRCIQTVFVGTNPG